MDTYLFIGGDFEEANIRNITNQYINNGGIKRFKKRTRGVVMQHYCEITQRNDERQEPLTSKPLTFLFQFHHFQE